MLCSVRRGSSARQVLPLCTSKGWGWAHPPSQLHSPPCCTWGVVCTKGSPDLSSAGAAVQGRRPAAVRFSVPFPSLPVCSAWTVLAGKGNLLSQALSAVVWTLLNGTWKPTDWTGRNGSVAGRRGEQYDCTGGSKIEQKSGNGQMDTIAKKSGYNESVMIGETEETK